MYFLELLVAFSLISPSYQQDPLKNFCRIFGHQTAVVDRKLFIYGGLVNWGPMSANSNNVTNTWFRYGDVDVINQGFPQEYANLSMDTPLPLVQGGVLWEDEANKVIYAYGGESNGETALPPPYLWYYDIVYNTWNSTDATTADISDASWAGAGVAVEDRGTGYYYGGWLRNASTPTYGYERHAQSTMLIFDMLGNTFTTSPGPDEVPRAEGSMLYLPVGDGGFLVYFGGVQQPYGNWTVVANIFLYDIANNLWYNETATGDVPESRRRFCAGATWADDRTSYNIYLFGGASIFDGVGYGDVYILSLPSFTWIKWWPRPEDNIGATYPHHSLSCNVINYQMIIMGGTFPNETSHCDMPNVYGQHGLDLGKANPSQEKWETFRPNITTYQVPPEILQTIGGGPTGGATVLAPTSGWTNRDLSVEFQRLYTPSTRAPTRFIPTPTSAVFAPPAATFAAAKSNREVVIGGAVGGALGALLLSLFACVLFLCIRKRKNKPHQPPPVEADTSQPAPDLPPGGSAKIAPPSTQNSPNLSQTFNPQDSSYPRSGRTFSYQSNAVPEYPGQRMYSPPQDELYLPPIYGPGVHSQQQPLAAGAYEMPLSRSPPGFPPPGFPPPGFPPPIQTQTQQAIDPYYAQHPPSPPRGE
ncbi:hypothetical protein AOQ84DRAFT_403499 [Glonium stellatum]|uniref:Kelch repeat-containing protein n=1 Tax=Glonium stellatum TaxID=574774 RepID=A0A8E2EMB7_9PEZI|nr:hypothetical protein AOQ84DRAFT_403499 [Glonium stellatum]